MFIKYNNFLRIFSDETKLVQILIAKKTYKVNIESVHSDIDKGSKKIMLQVTCFLKFCFTKSNKFYA